MNWDEPHHEIRHGLPDGTVQGCPASPGGLFISTLEGEMTASAGDWIIRGVHGEFYPCRADIFAETYDEVTESSEAVVLAHWAVDVVDAASRSDKAELRDAARSIAGWVAGPVWPVVQRMANELGMVAQ